MSPGRTLPLVLLALALLADQAAIAKSSNELLRAELGVLGWSVSGAELALVAALPRPPGISRDEAMKSCMDTVPAYSDEAAKTAWGARSISRVLTIWGVAHYGARAASGTRRNLCQDLAFLAARWRAGIGRSEAATVNAADAQELKKAITDIEWGRQPDFGNRAVGVDSARFRIAIEPPPALTDEASPDTALRSQPGGANQQQDSDLNPQSSAAADESRRLAAMTPRDAEAYCADDPVPANRIAKCEAVLGGQYRFDSAQRARIFMRKGNAELAIGHAPQAVVSFGEAIKFTSAQYPGYLFRAEALRVVRDFAAARRDIDMVLAIGHPESLYDAYIERGIILSEQRDFRAALASFDKAIAIHPNDNERAVTNRRIAERRMRIGP